MGKQNKTKSSTTTTLSDFFFLFCFGEAKSVRHFAQQSIGYARCTDNNKENEKRKKEDSRLFYSDARVVEDGG